MQVCGQGEGAMSMNTIMSSECHLYVITKTYDIIIILYYVMKQPVDIYSHVDHYFNSLLMHQV